MSAIRLQFLLKPEHRNKQGAADTTRVAEQLGLMITGTGAASLSARCERSDFVRIFGVEPLHGPVGTVPDKLAIPAALADYITSASIAPPHLKFDD